MDLLTMLRAMTQQSDTPVYSQQDGPVWSSNFIPGLDNHAPPPGIPTNALTAPERPALLAPPPVDTSGMMAKLAKYGQALGQGTGNSMDLGVVNLPHVSAPQIAAPDYTQSDQAFASATPHPISAAQYVKPHYEASDALYEKAKPQAMTQQQLEDDKWGRILAGAAQSFLGADNHRLLAGILGGLGGYGSALSNRTKMAVDQADKLSEFYLKDAGYESGKADSIANVDNSQATANYSADRSNQTELGQYYRALGGYDASKAENRANIASRNAELGFDAAKFNAQSADKKDVKIVGQTKDGVVYQYLDKNGHLNVAIKPFGTFSQMNGGAQGKMAGGDPSAAGLEALIGTLRNAGKLRDVLGPEYDKLVSPEQDYGMAGKYGALGTMGDKGKEMALERSQAEENAKIADYFMSHPDVLDASLNMVLGQ